jgi:Bacterial Ig-like domain
VESLAEANEIRVVFSEPMVVLGRIPQPVQAPFFTMTPAVRGKFRWSGSTILIFTPAREGSLSLASRYEVRIDASATALSGRRLLKPYTFAFTTPTAKLRSTNWYRKNGRFDSPVMVLLRFNQPMRPADVVAHATIRFESHRFLAVGDTAFFGSVINSQLKEGGTAVVTVRSLDPGVLEIKGDLLQRFAMAAGGTAEVRFNAAAKSVGRARVQMTVRLRGESDAFEEVVPVEIPSSPETVAAYGEARPDAREKLNVPTGVVPGFSGLQLELSSTAMVGSVRRRRTLRKCTSRTCSDGRRRSRSTSRDERGRANMPSLKNGAD